MARTIRHGSDYNAHADNVRGCKIRRTFNSMQAAYPTATEDAIVRMVARRTGQRIETVRASV